MRFEDFKIKYAETMMYYQMIEHDVKLIYSYMHQGNIDDNYDSIENKTLGVMLRKLKELDESDGVPYINSQDYNFLIQICDNRNHWAHKVFSEFIYEQNFEKSKEYKRQCEKLEKDCKRVYNAARILEEIRIEYCS